MGGIPTQVMEIEHTMKINAISTVSVFVEKVDEATDFYSKTLNLGKPTKSTPKWVEWNLGKGSSLSLQKAPTELLEGSVPARSTVRFSFEVADIKVAYNELFEKGVRVLSEPQEGTGYLYVEFLDLDGNVLRAVQNVK